MTGEPGWGRRLGCLFQRRAELAGADWCSVLIGVKILGGAPGGG
ncbi:MAG: hypothetical protein ACLRWQ_01535 [Flavonifractor plautii]